MRSPNHPPDTITRRRLLQIGGLGLLGLSLPRLAHAAGRGARAKSVIFLHQFGGPSCHDSFDMKPDAPDAIRGEFKPIASSAPASTSANVCRASQGSWTRSRSFAAFGTR